MLLSEEITPLAESKSFSAVASVSPTAHGSFG